MKKHTMAALALAVGGFASSNAMADDCDVYVYGPQNGVHSGGAGYDVTLWPPNHKMTTVAVAAANESCDVDITGVFQDEAIDEPGSGNTTEFDAANCHNGGNEASVELRAERSGRGTGRFYEIDYVANHFIEIEGQRMPDVTKQPEEGTVVVLVPHDQRRDQTQWANELESVEDDARTPSATGMICDDQPAANADETSNPAKGKR